jgi:CBS domain-containing protein
MSFPISKLIESQEDVVTIISTATVRDALSKMVANDFSQLPIVDGDGKLVGIVSEQSITDTLFHTQGKVPMFAITVDNCKAMPLTLPPEADLFEALRQMQDAPALVVVQDGTPVGIVTYFDTTNFFRDNNEGLMYVEDIEVGLRKYAQDILHTDALLDTALIHVFGESKQNPGHPNKSYDKLTFYEQVQFLTHEKNWAHFEPYFKPRDLFVTLMDEVRLVRNQLAHFRNRIDTVQRHGLLHARAWLLARPRVQRAEASSVKIVTDVTAQANVVSVSGKASGRYVPLKLWLERQPASDKTLQLSFQQVEEILGATLPPAAYEHPSWWANDSAGHVQSRYWLEAGWRVDEVNVNAKTIIFERTHAVRYQLFYADVLDRLQQRSPGLANGVSARPRNWLEFGSGLGGVSYRWRFTSKHTVRISLYISTGDKGRNEHMYDQLYAWRTQLEPKLAPLTLLWERLDGNQACRVSIERDGRVTDPPETIAVLKEWAAEKMVVFHEAVQPFVEQLRDVE